MLKFFVFIVCMGIIGYCIYVFNTHSKMNINNRFHINFKSGVFIFSVFIIIFLLPCDLAYSNSSSGNPNDYKQSQSKSSSSSSDDVHQLLHMPEKYQNGDYNPKTFKWMLVHSGSFSSSQISTDVNMFSSISKKDYRTTMYEDAEQVIGGGTTDESVSEFQSTMKHDYHEAMKYEHQNQ